MAINFDLSGIDDLNRKLDRIGPLFMQQARALVAETVLFAEVAIADKIDEYEAVDTGRLKGSISSKTAMVPGDSATTVSASSYGANAQVAGIVGTNLKYAIPVHEGYTTRRGRQIAGRPFMRDALPEIESLFEKRARDRFGGLLS
jgi:hypothetical protein